jgi:hypothetical protein
MQRSISQDDTSSSAKPLIEQSSAFASTRMRYQTNQNLTFSINNLPHKSNTMVSLYKKISMLAHE